VNPENINLAEMAYRKLGKTGYMISPLVLGTDNFMNPTPEEDCIRMVEFAIENGINLIDTSNSYAAGNAERIIGKAIKNNGLRGKILVATKVFYPTGPEAEDRGLSRNAILKACEDSLRRLDTDYIDLYQLHRPDFTVPQEETLETLDLLVKQGKVRFIGSSTAPAWRIIEGLKISRNNQWPQFVSEQPPYNLLDRRIENELVPLCIKEELGILCWSPMAMGMLAGRYLPEKQHPEDSRSVKRKGIYAERVTAGAIQAGNRFARFAMDSGYDPAQLSIAWVKEQPGITSAIIGPKSVEQLKHLIPVMEMSLPNDIQASLNEMFPPGTAVADFHNTSGWTDKLGG
jgi:aryl-alcohol dehydrogenase-like predicted oxidoreductase